MKTNVKFIAHIFFLTLFLISNSVYSQNLSNRGKDNTLNNDSVSTHRSFQLSLLPYISINHVPANSVADISLNLIAGYVGGVSVFEAGSVLNLDRGDAGKCQLAGVGNLVGGSSRGFQAAGVINITQSLKGVQTAGVINIVKSDAGVCQLAGVGNISGGSFQGLQAAGVYNFTENVNGVQLAGVFNNAREVSGIQISGLINHASYIKGVQISVFNFADSCQGTPIGIFSFINNGYHRLEISADEIFYTNLAFRTGVNRFYTIFDAGIRPDNFETPLWSFGYGIGTRFVMKSNLSYDLELSSHHVSKGKYSDFESDLYKLYFGIDRKIASKTAVAIGVTYNCFITDTDARHYNEKISLIAPYTITNHTYRNGINMKAWIGGKISFRFL
jgi:hypothetical protein